MIGGVSVAEAAANLQKASKHTGFSIGYDQASPGGDYGVTTIWEKPSRLRLLMRRLGLDKSTWQMRLKGTIMHPPHSLSISNVKKVTPSISKKDYS